ncbi:MAG: ABC transporter permease [Bacteroidales bacterium]
MIERIKAVFRRELKQMFSRPIYLFGSVFTLVFCSIFFLSLLNEGLPMKLPIGLIDNDHSSISRRFYRELNSLQGVYITKYYANHQEARMAMQDGEIFGFIEVPHGMYSNILSNRRPAIGLYSNQAFMIPGTLTYKNFLTMGNLASGAVQREVLRAKGYNEDAIMGMIQPILIDSHYIGNPWSHYGIYLINVILPGILQLCIILMTIFSIGYELKVKTSREWLRTAGHSMFYAITGKLLPYTIIFTIMGLGLNVLLYRIMNFPLNGSILMMFAATFLLVLAAQSVGIFMIGLFPVLRDGVSFSAIYGIISISIAGMTFPLESMPAPIYGVGQVFPLRHYYLIYVQEGMFNGGFAICWAQYIALVCFMFLPLIIIKRLNRALIHQNYPVK